MFNLTVSIVNFNAGEYLLKTVDSLMDCKDEANLNIYIIDNNSSDDSINLLKKKYPKLHYILNSENKGFGKAHNQVLKENKNDYILILNPDMILNKGTLQDLLEYLEKNPKVGAVTPKIIFENGSVDMTAHRGFPTPWASLLYFLGNDSLYHLTKNNMNSVHEVDAITGAFFLTKKKVLDEVGYFDEDYFMYAEDIDLCYRIKKAGFEVIYDPEVEVLHYKGISSGLKQHSQHLSNADLETKKRSLSHFYKTMKIFYDKHYKNQYPKFVTSLVYLGINLRWKLALRKLTV